MSLALLAAVVGIAPQRPHTITGVVRTHTAFESKVLANKRDILVWLPPQYGTEPSRRFPVLYMHDGQNAFDAATSFAGEWRADEAATGLIGANLVEPVIIVAVPNMGVERANEYLPTRARNMGGKADLYGEFLAKELKPFVDRTYRTKTGSMDTGLIGSSLGGIVTLHLGLAKPSVFGKLGVVSPSVWWDDRLMLKRVAALPKKTSSRIWVDIGSDESPAAMKDAEDLRDALIAKGWKRGKDLAFYLDWGAKHNEAAWSGRMGEILMFLFPAKR
ncbi:alpha/beta hydrolase [bacterium]|nr:MAG: alpha/beta hydrolase [bacterium]